MFTHTKEVDMTYWDHLSSYMKLSYCFAKASLSTFMCALYPPLLLTYTSDPFSLIIDELDTNDCKNKKEM